jgi:Caspase domain
MSLVPHPNERGLWVNNKPGADGAGLHALIVGVSRYDHLKDGALSRPDGETYGLGQLAVSAMTALRFFGWLSSDYALGDLPLAQVRLLLSPQRKGVAKADADELADCDQGIVEWTPEANFENCKSAIRNWYRGMTAIKRPTTARSLLFFSGHGMQITRANQLLLPCDYGNPNGALDEAIRTQNLFECLSSLPAVPSHVLLIDACRDDIEILRKVVGTNVIDEVKGPGDPHLELRVLRATAFGLKAYQPTTAGGMSLFGQALLDGLSAKPNPVLAEPAIMLSRRGKVFTVEINDLQAYMNGRIDALIKAAKEDVVQVVRGDDSQSAAARIDVTELVQSAPVLSEVKLDQLVEEVIQDVEHRPGTIKILTEGEASTSTKRQQPRSAAQRPGAWFARRYRRQEPSPPGPVTFNGLHKILGSEAFADPWLNLRVESLSSGSAIDSSKVRMISAAQTAHKGNLHGIQAHIYVESPMELDPIGCVLTIKDFSGQSFCTILPTDPKTHMFKLEIDRIDGSFVRFATYFSPRKEPGSFETANVMKVASLWDKMRALSAPAAAKLLGAPDATVAGEHALKHKMKSPLAAAVGAALLLRANRLDLMRDWARNLARWFETIPDGVVFWIEQCRRQRVEFTTEATAWFVEEMRVRSLPFTCDAFAMAASIVRDIERDRLPADGPTKVGAALLRDRIDAVMPYFRDDGLFCTYAGLPDGWQAAKMLGPSETRSAPAKPAPFDPNAKPAR